MYERCSLTHCEWANSQTGACFWDKRRCPRAAEQKAEEDKNNLTRKADIDKWRDERKAEALARIEEAQAKAEKERQKGYREKRKEMKVIAEQKRLESESI
jgi:hypothetical protein